MGRVGLTAGLSQGFEVLADDYYTPYNTVTVCPGNGCVAPGDVIPGTCVGCSPDMVNGVMIIAQFVSENPGWDSINFFVGSSNVGYAYNFPAGAFSSPGIHDTWDVGGNPGTLVVSNVPEPATASLIGIAAALWLTRRLRRRA